MASTASLHDDQDTYEGDGGKRKRKKRFIRSKNGCLTCKIRKVKCDEERPACLRCCREERECTYLAEQVLPSPGRPVTSSQHYQQGAWCHPYGEGHLTKANHSDQSAILPDPPSSTICDLPRQAGPVDAFEPTQYDDWLAYLFGSSDQNTPHTDLDSCISEWMINNSVFLTESTSSEVSPSRAQSRHVPAFHTVGEDQGAPSHRRNVDSALQRRLRELCTSAVQLEAVTQFFNFVAQCFHLLSAEVNAWRRVYAELSCQSPFTLTLVTSVGLVSLSLSGPVNRRPLAYALLTKGISQWQAIVQEGQGANCSKLNELQVLEIIAGAMLIGHVEQFDTGIAVHTIACMREARNIVDAVVDGMNCNVDLRPGSHFRFLLRSFLWWDTLSRTMGSGSGGAYPKNAFEMVRCWEEKEEEDTISMTQGHIGWPLDLLEAVARTQALAEQLNGSHMDDVVSKQEMRAIESQIRNCRPRVVSQDTVLIAELRYVVYEALQAGAHIYFARKLLGDTKSVQRDVEKVMGFLNRRDVRGGGIVSDREAQRHVAACGTAVEEEDSVDHAHSRPYYLTNAMKKRGIWKERAPDGALLWSYLQSAMAIEGRAMQDACRQTLSRWETFKDFGAVSLQFELLELIWEKKREDRHKSWTEDDICLSVMQERRWRQLLIF